MTQIQPVDPDAAVFPISVAAELAGMHPQTLRTYDRLELVQPARTSGRGRRYSPRDVSKLRLIQHLSQEEGINLEGIRRILSMEEELDHLRGRVEELTRLLAEVQADQSATGVRLFTAESTGAVHLGRIRSTLRALPGAS